MDRCQGSLNAKRRPPQQRATAVLMLVFGIGATSAIFSIVHGVLLRPLPFPGASRLATQSGVHDG